MKPRGFTLLELIITLFILVLLLTIGLPSFSKQIQSTRTKTAAIDLMQAVQHARTLAVSRNKRATLTHSGKWEDGFEVFVDLNDNGLREADEELIFQTEPAENIVIHANQPVNKYVSFIGTGESRFVGKAKGGGFQAGTFRICSEDKTLAGHTLILARSGRMRMEDLPASECVPFKSAS